MTILRALDVKKWKVGRVALPNKVYAYEHRGKVPLLVYTTRTDIVMGDSVDFNYFSYFNRGDSIYGEEVYALTGKPWNVGETAVVGQTYRYVWSSGHVTELVARELTVLGNEPDFDKFDVRGDANVKDFGAVGNGIADDTEALKKSNLLPDGIFVHDGSINPYEYTGTGRLSYKGTPALTLPSNHTNFTQKRVLKELNFKFPDYGTALATTPHTELFPQAMTLHEKRVYILYMSKGGKGVSSTFVVVYDMSNWSYLGYFKICDNPSEGMHVITLNNKTMMYTKYSKVGESSYVGEWDVSTLPDNGSTLLPTRKFNVNMSSFLTGSDHNLLVQVSSNRSSQPERNLFHVIDYDGNFKATKIFDSFEIGIDADSQSHKTQNITYHDGYYVSTHGSYNTESTEQSNYYQLGVKKWGTDCECIESVRYDAKTTIEQIRSKGYECTVVEYEGICSYFGSLVSLLVTMPTNHNGKGGLLLLEECASGELSLSNTQSLLGTQIKNSYSSIPIHCNTASIKNPLTSENFKSLYDIMTFMLDTSVSSYEFYSSGSESVTDLSNNPIGGGVFVKLSTGNFATFSIEEISSKEHRSFFVYKDATGKYNHLLLPFNQTNGLVPNCECKLNLHFGTMHGNPYQQGETDGTVNYTVAADRVKGSYEITLASVSGLIPNQTIVYLCSDGTYKTNVIDSIISNTVNLKKPLQKNVNSGPNFWNFWDDKAHANEVGYYAIADDAIEELRYVGVVEAVVLPENLITLAVADDIQILNANKPDSVGCTSVSSAMVTASAESNGAKSNTIMLTAGLYKVTGVVNPSVDGSISELLVGIRQSRKRPNTIAPVTQLVTYTYLTAKNCPTYFEFTFYAQDRHYHELVFQVDNAGRFEVGKCEFVKVTDNINDLNRGKHVLFGDSWIDRGHIYDRLVERLPNATFVKKGNAGYASDQLFDVFDAQVPVHKPNTVWLLCSTNDFFRDYTIDKFNFEMGKIKEKIFDIGANCISWDSTVGSNDDPDTSYRDNLALSRQYALESSYRKSNVKLDDAPAEKVRDSLLIDASIPAGAEVFAGTFASTERDVNVVFSAFENNRGVVTVKMGFASSISPPISGIKSWPENQLKRPRDDLNLEFISPYKFPVVSLTNTSAEPVKIKGTITVEYYPEN